MTRGSGYNPRHLCRYLFCSRGRFWYLGLLPPFVSEPQETLRLSKPTPDIVYIVLHELTDSHTSDEVFRVPSGRSG